MSYGSESRQEQFERGLTFDKEGELSEGPLGGRLHAYRQFMIGEIQKLTGPLYDIGNLSAKTLEALYSQIIGKTPRQDFVDVLARR